MNPTPKIAVVHDWLTVYAGAERVLEQILACYPQADLFAVVDFLPAADRHRLGGRQAQTTFIQRLPGARKRYRSYLPLMPLAVEQLDLSAYELVISSSHAVAKGVITGPDQLHISYVHSPIRYAWDLQHQYLRESGLSKGLKSWLARWFLHRIRIWDLRTANGVDEFVANSQFIARRIRKAYRREAQVIYPPVDVERFVFQAQKQDHYVTASRMVPYKRMPAIVTAFANMPSRRLRVLGDGPEMPAVRVAAAGAGNIEILGYQSDAALRDQIQQARAFVFAAEEDFGILPVEAQACGTPVIALGRGGATESVIGLDQERPTGVLFETPTPAGIQSGVEAFERNAARITPQACRENALRFSASRFREEFTDLVQARLTEFRSGQGSVTASPEAGESPPIT